MDTNSSDSIKIINIDMLMNAIHEFEEASSEDAKKSILQHIKTLVEPGFENSDGGEDITFDTYGDPIFTAICTGNLEVVSTLVNAGASVNIMEPDDFTTPLFVAKNLGYDDIAEYLEPLTNSEFKKITEELL